LLEERESGRYREVRHSEAVRDLAARQPAAVTQSLETEVDVLAEVDAGVLRVIGLRAKGRRVLVSDLLLLQLLGGVLDKDQEPEAPFSRTSDAPWRPGRGRATRQGSTLSKKMTV
jgi:hypothetical protein